MMNGKPLAELIYFIPLIHHFLCIDIRFIQFHDFMPIVDFLVVELMHFTFENLIGLLLHSYLLFHSLWILWLISLVLCSFNSCQMRQISIVPLVIAFLVPLGNDMIDRSFMLLNFIQSHRFPFLLDFPKLSLIFPFLSLLLLFKLLSKKYV